MAITDIFDSNYDQMPLDAQAAFAGAPLGYMLPPFPSPPSRAPAATQNAVGISNAAYGMNDRGAGYDGSRPPPSSATTGLPGVTDTGISSDNGAIVRRGNTYSNLGVAGLDSIDNRRSTQLPSVAGFLAGVKPFGAGASNAPTAGLPTPTNPMQGRLDSILNRSQSLLSSNSLVDNWRGRQLAKMYDRLLAGQVAQQNANTNTGQLGIAQGQLGVAQGHLANELPIHMLQNSTAQRGQDYQLAVHLPTIERTNMENRLLGQGRSDEAATMARIGQHPYFAPAQAAIHGDQLTGVTKVDRDGGLTFYSPAEIKAQQDQRLKDQAAAKVR
jgi:hypothetical protein